MYFKSFVFPETDRDVYPHSVMAEKNLGRVEFAPITIFYGGNGSGKSTVCHITLLSLDRETQISQSFFYPIPVSNAPLIQNIVLGTFVID